MKIVEMNEGAKIAYEVDDTKLDFAGGALTVDLDRYRRDYPVTKDVMADGDGNLVLGTGGRYYVAQVEIPAIPTARPRRKRRQPKRWPRQNRTPRRGRKQSRKHRPPRR